MIFNSNYYWLIGALVVIIVQAFIVNHWSNAKYWTILNAIFLIATIISYSAFSFKNKVSKERVQMLKSSTNISQKVITEKDISHLPAVVQKWLVNGGVMGKKPITNIRLTQDLQLKMTPEQNSWNNGIAEQYITVQPPTFNWSIKTRMGVMGVVGRDKFEHGQGEMVIKLMSLVSVANAKQSEKVDQATLQRYLAEIVWYPTASLSPYIVWEQIDGNTAKATMKVNDTKGAGAFYFDDHGNFLKFTALRYKDLKDKEPKLWTVSAIKTEERNGIRMPVELKADWKLDNGDWTWLKLKIKAINYNVTKTPTVGNMYAK
ncbi:DUF6544 family protein [uncultured Microscilla sp.]|uniref:DUF6544 family protein n=1 Tax=uncultured Microscilla sp. TaxID=432653 RepID=UPI0026248E8E|nr:DUF6544 family protein [uncultured Microscilla sp.]